MTSDNISPHLLPFPNHPKNTSSTKPEDSRNFKSLSTFFFEICNISQKLLLSKFLHQAFPEASHPQSSKYNDSKIPARQGPNPNTHMQKITKPVRTVPERPPPLCALFRDQRHNIVPPATICHEARTRSPIGRA